MPSSTQHTAILITNGNCLVVPSTLDKRAESLEWPCMVQMYLVTVLVIFCVFCVFRVFMSICIICVLRVFFEYVSNYCSAAHEDRVAIFKSASWYALLDEEVDEIFSSSNAAVLVSYIDGLIKTSVRLWKFIMPKDARDVFQKEVFHPTTVSSKLQLHLGMTTSRRIFNVYFVRSDFHAYYVYLTFFAYSCQFLDSWPERRYEFFCPPPIPKKNADCEEDSSGAMTGEDYDLMLHCTIGHMHHVDGAEQHFEDGAKTLDFFAGNRQHRYVFCMFCLFCAFCIFSAYFVYLTCSVLDEQAYHSQV
jgi:hypothetical protein